MSPSPWSWRSGGAFDTYSRNALHAASLAYLPRASALYGLFALLDVLYVPAVHLPGVLAMRTAVTSGLVGIYLWLRRRGPGLETGMLAACAPTIAALGVSWMSSLWERGANGYAAGVTLCVFSVGFLTRLPLHALAATGFVLVTFLMGHLIPGPLSEGALLTFIAHVAFVAGAGILTVLQSYTAYVLRHAAFTAKQETEALNASLEAQVLARTAQLSEANAAFLRFVPAEFLGELGYADITRARLGDACERNLTVMFSDIRNFTRIAEGLPPEQVFGLLNHCLTQVGPPVRLHGGFIDKYVGDAILALFPRSPADAVRAAVDMQRALDGLRALPVSMGVGIHVGDVIMGTIGEEQRFEVTVIADAVNLSARLEALTRPLGCRILVSRAVWEALDGPILGEARSVGRFAVKGKAHSVEIFDIYAADPPEAREHKQRSREDFEAALAAYRTGEAGQARDALVRIVEACPQDGPARWWLQRAEQALLEAEGFRGEPYVSLSEK